MEPGEKHPTETEDPLLRELQDLLNRHSAERLSGTPDFTLAGFLMDCLRAWNRAQNRREQWYGRRTSPPEGEE